MKEHKENPKKNSGFSGPSKDDGKPKNSKDYELGQRKIIWVHLLINRHI